MGASWTWFLDDANGSGLCELSTASGRSISYKRNTYSEATFTIGHEDDAASLLTAALSSTGIPTLRAYRRPPTASAGVLQFRGYLVAVQSEADESSLMTCTFRSPFGRLVGNGSDAARFLTAVQTFLGQDAGAIAKGLVDIANADGATGLTCPTPPTTKTRDRTYPVGQNIGQAIVDLSAVLDGFDFFETYLDGVGGTFSQLNIVAQQGSDNGAARFEYGAGTLGNIQHISHTSSAPINRAIVIGGNGLSATKDDLTSQAKYGLFPTLQSASDVMEQATLDDKAQALLRPNPVQTIAFTPEVGMDSCPAFFDDYGLGDTVRIYARRGGLNVNAVARVNAATVVIDDEGNEAVEVQDPTTPEEDAVARALLQVEVIST